MRLILIILLIILLIVACVSVLFLKMVLAAPSDRKEKVMTPLLCLDTAAADDDLKQQFIANRTRLRADGALFDQTMSNVEIVNKSGLKLYGRYRFRPETTHDWIISVHGYKDDHRFMLPYIMNFYEHGFNVFTQDNRAHGLSDGDYISMGWHDKDDIYEWIDCIVRMDPDARVYVHGVSMGGATTMMVAGMNHPAVVGYIEDCGYTSVWDIFKVVINRDYHLPTFPIIDCCRLMSNIIMKYDYKRASSLKQLTKCSKPIMFIHGENDGFVPAWMGQRCYDSYTGPKTLYIAPDAGHAESMDYDPDTYFTKIYAFIDSIRAD